LGGGCLFEVNTERVLIKLWLDDIESGALAQATRLANLPFTFSHVAIMPDSHLGVGMPIGGVLALEDTVIPNAVGVDIGCFTGNTKIALLSGVNKSLKELYEDKKDIWVYSMDENNIIVPALAKPLLTRLNAELMEVVISGGFSIRCTLDHKFMLLDGSYKEAKDLKEFDSLMPLYRSYQSRDGYEYVSSSNKRGKLTHVLVSEFVNGKSNKIVHHKDLNWYNNTPSNLVLLTESEHSTLHSQDNKYFNSDKFKERRQLLYKNRGYVFAPNLLEKKQIIAKENLKGYLESEQFKVDSKNNDKRGREYLIAYNKSDKGRKKSSENGIRFGFGKNHKVLFTKKLDCTEDVYCLNVPKYNNFALEAGVFVHNCGMHVVKFDLNEISKDTLVKILGDIRKYIPVGFNHREKEVDVKFMPKGQRHYALDENISWNPIVCREFSAATKQCGTLGGGNHFAEIQSGRDIQSVGEDNFIYAMIHSGSRNVGKQVCDHYNRVAKELNSKWHTNVPKEWDLASLPVDSEEGQYYINEMNWCLEFAKCNRQYMMDIIKQSFLEHTGARVLEELDVHHNYANEEKHFGRNVWVHRKGATSAQLGELGIIPGSQGTSSYIVEGLGNMWSFKSCSHGAGRRMGRNEAKKQLNLENEKKKLDEQGILHSVRNINDLDEASGAYKDIDIVMENQKDLVKIRTKLKPLAVVKG